MFVLHIWSTFELLKYFIKANKFLDIVFVPPASLLLHAIMREQRSNSIQTLNILQPTFKSSFQQITQMATGTSGSPHQTVY